VEILVAHYQAQKNSDFDQIAWKLWLRIIKRRKIAALTNSVEI
jgi:hypothetical protein